MARGGFIFSRNTLIVLNILYFMIGVTLIVLAAYCKALAIITTVPVMGGIIVCGVFLSIIAILGVVGAAKHHQVMLFFYMVILFLIFLLQFSVACASLGLTDYQEYSFFQIGWKFASDDLKMRTQSMFGCCGMDQQHQFINNYTQKDFNHPRCDTLFPDDCLVNNVTVACCMQYQPDTNDTNLTSTIQSITTTIPLTNLTTLLTTTTITPHSTPPSQKCPVLDCWSLVEPKLHKVVRIVGFVSLFFSFTLLIGIWLTFRYRNQKDPRANPSAFL